MAPTGAAHGRNELLTRRLPAGRLFLVTDAHRIVDADLDQPRLGRSRARCSGGRPRSPRQQYVPLAAAGNVAGSSQLVSEYDWHGPLIQRRGSTGKPRSAAAEASVVWDWGLQSRVVAGAAHDLRQRGHSCDVAVAGRPRACREAARTFITQFSSSASSSNADSQ
jgi:hypothetical protein